MQKPDSNSSASGVEPQLDCTSVLQTIREGRKHSRVIWTPSTLLHWLGVRGVGQAYPKLLRRRAKRSLEQLCDEGQLIRRHDAHSGRSGREIAYMLPEGRQPTTAFPKELVYDPQRGRSLLAGERTAQRRQNE